MKTTSEEGKFGIIYYIIYRVRVKMARPCARTQTVHRARTPPPVTQRVAAAAAKADRLPSMRRAGDIGSSSRGDSAMALDLPLFHIKSS